MVGYGGGFATHLIPLVCHHLWFYNGGAFRGNDLKTPTRMTGHRYERAITKRFPQNHRLIGRLIGRRALVHDVHHHPYPYQCCDIGDGDGCGAGCVLRRPFTSR